MGVKGVINVGFFWGVEGQKNVIILFKSLLFSSMMSFIAPIINLTSFSERKNKVTNGRTDGQTKGVTMSLLELLMAAKNNQIIRNGLATP